MQQKRRVGEEQKREDFSMTPSRKMKSMSVLDVPPDGYKLCRVTLLLVTKTRPDHRRCRLCQQLICRMSGDRNDKGVESIRSHFPILDPLSFLFFLTGLRMLFRFLINAPASPRSSPFAPFNPT